MVKYSVLKSIGTHKLSKSLYTTQEEKQICFLHVYDVYLCLCLASLFAHTHFKSENQPLNDTLESLKWYAESDLLFELFRNKQWKDRPALPVMRSTLD